VHILRMGEAVRSLTHVLPWREQEQFYFYLRAYVDSLKIEDAFRGFGSARYYRS
jgi:hypothetical protein